MNAKRLPFVILAYCALFLTACGTPARYDYYLLSADSAGAPGGEAPAVGVGPVTVPEYLVRDNLVWRREGNILQVADLHRWAEPMAEGIARVVTLNLSGLLDTQDVRQFPWHPGPPPDYAVSINVLALEAGDAEAVLTAEWLLYRPGEDPPVGRRLSRLRRQLPAGLSVPAALAPAYSALLDQLSREIAAAIRAADTAPRSTD